ncbi:hypothetical protein LT493_09160 [Streptomyces tricolor]|nr:hypothetical protein [Streptomyces tricolor]
MSTTTRPRTAWTPGQIVLTLLGMAVSVVFLAPARLGPVHLPQVGDRGRRGTAALAAGSTGPARRGRPSSTPATSRTGS